MNDRRAPTQRHTPFTSLACALAAWAVFVGVGAAIYIKPFQPIRFVIVVASMTAFLVMWGGALRAARGRSAAVQSGRSPNGRSGRAAILSGLAAGGALVLLATQALGWVPLDHLIASWVAILLVLIAAVAAIVTLSDPQPQAGKRLAAWSLVTLVIVVIGYRWLA